MNTLHSGNNSTSESFFGYFTTWHKTLLRSYIKQNLNNVWLYIVNVPEYYLAKTSPYHTYCVAVELGYLDHTPVPDWFSKQMEYLMKGNLMYCGHRRSVIHVKLGAVANLADHPETSFTLKTSLLRTYGQVASWATNVDPKVLPDCDHYFKEQVRNLFEIGLGEKNVDGKFGRCCQWDLTSSSPALKNIFPQETYPKRTEDGAPEPPLGCEAGVRFLKQVQQMFEMLIFSVI